MLPNNPREKTSALPVSVAEPSRRGGDSKPRIALIIYHADGAEMVMLLPDLPITVGREVPSDVRIADPTLSREHARFVLTEGRILVTDLDSTNGTSIRGARVGEAEIHLGDEVLLGSLLASVQAIGPQENNLGLESDERFRMRLEEEVVRAHYCRSRFAVLMVRATSVPSGEREVQGGLVSPRSPSGTQTQAGAVAYPDTHVGRWSPAVRGALRPMDRIALYSRDALQIVMPDAPYDVALDVARAITARRRTGEPRLFVGLAMYPDAATEAEKLIELARGALSGAGTDEPVQIAKAALWLAGEAPTLDPSAPPAPVGEGAIIAGPVMRELLETVTRLAASRIPVILQGETGVGKEVLARLIHESGPRKERPMVCVNCGAIPPQLVESTLFGHERGAFTGATQQQKGVFEEADGGTVFLDEIGELPLAAQAALLRVLETKRLTRVGSTREIAADERIIAATHRDLDAMCIEGTFREDLYYRMNTMMLTIPPLRDRTDEIEPLALRFLRQANEANHGRVRAIDPRALSRLKDYAWPGNVRELRNAIERAVVIARTNTIQEHDLPARVRAADGPASRRRPPLTTPLSLPDPEETTERMGAVESVRRSSRFAPVYDTRSSRPSALAEPPLPTPAEGFSDLKLKLQRYESQLILDALRSTRWNQTEAARALGMPLRTLVHKIKVLDIKKLDR